MKRFTIILGLFFCIMLKSLNFSIETPAFMAEETDEEAEGASEESDFA